MANIKIIEDTKATVWSNQNTHTLLLETQNDATTLQMYIFMDVYICNTQSYTLSTTSTSGKV